MSKLREAAEKYADESSTDLAETDDEQALFRNGVEFGFQQGARWAVSEAAKVAEEYGDSHETWRGYAISERIRSLAGGEG